MLKETSCLIRISQDELDRWKAHAAASSTTLSAWIRDACARQMDRSIDAPAVDAPRERPLVPPVSRPEPFIPVKPRPGFKRHPKCQSGRCRRFQSPTCDLCREENAIPSR